MRQTKINIKGILVNGLFSMFLLCALACGSEKEAPPETPEEEALTQVERRALAREFQLQAEEEITEQNAEDELAKLEKEIAADIE